MDKATEEKLRQFEGMKKKIPDFIKDDEPIRQPVAKLAKLLTNNPKKHLGLQPITKEDYEYWGLAAIATDEEAELACWITCHGQGFWNTTVKILTAKTLITKRDGTFLC